MPSRARPSPPLTPFLTALTLAATVAAQSALPTPNGPINDFADVLATADEERLTRVVAGVEQATSAEIAVATVTSLDGVTVEEYATKLFAAWGIGQADVDNGVLILVAPTERAMRIEVGYGLEDVLPDGLAGQIIRETFLPSFRANNYARGIVEGTERVAAIVRRNETLTPAQQEALAAAERQASMDPKLPFLLIPFFGLFVSIGFGMVGAGVGARAFGPIPFGIVFGGIPLGLSAIVDIPVAPRILGGVALVALVIGFMIGRRPGAGAGLRGSSAKGGGWVMGSGGSSGAGSRSSGGSSSSGGFSGGSSGGGGASGRW